MSGEVSGRPPRSCHRGLQSSLLDDDANRTVRARGLHRAGSRRSRRMLEGNNGAWAIDVQRCSVEAAAAVGRWVEAGGVVPWGH
jgi:hypothetical protein